MKNNHNIEGQLLTDLSSSESILLDIVTDSIFLTDFDGNLIYINKTAHESRGYSKAELMEINFNDLDTSEYSKQKKLQIKKLEKEGECSFKSAHFCKNRSIMPIEANVRIIELNGEKLILSVVRDISEHQKAEYELKKEHQKLISIIDSLPDATLVVDQNSNVIAWNRALEDLTGVSKEKIVGKGDYAYSVPFHGVRRPILIDLIFSPDKDIEALYDYVKREKDTLYAEAFVQAVLKGKGAYLWAKALPLYDDQDNFMGAIETVRNVTTYKKAKRKLEEQLNFLQYLMDTIPSPIFHKDINGVYKGCNSAFEEYIGLPSEKIINKTVYDIAPKEMADKYYEMDNELIENPGVQTYEAPVRYADGTKHQVLFNKATYFDTKDNVAGLIGVMLDITHRKEAEEALRKLKDQLEIKVKERTADLSIARDILQDELNAHQKTEEALIESEERYRGIVEGMQSGVISIDANAKIIYVNRQVSDMLGYTDKEMTGYKLFNFVNKEEQVKLNKHLQLRRNGIRETYELKFVRKDGSDLWTLISANPLFNAKSQYIGSVGIMTDITARKGVEKALKNAIDQKDNFTRLMVGNMIEAVNELISRDYSEFLDKQSKLT